MKLKSCPFPKSVFLHFYPKRQLCFSHSDGHDYYNQKPALPINIPCGKCLYCLNVYSTQYAVRCMLESKLYKDNCFITLTYDDEHLPLNNYLDKIDVQKFLKRLRRRLEPLKIRYFGCGEYGSKGLRPHYHLIIFNWAPDDLAFYKHLDGQDIYLSQFLTDVWGKGFTSVGIDMSVRTVKYSCKYLQKMNDIPESFPKPFLLMSRRPGIARDCIDSKFLKDGAVYLDGVAYSIPPYFLKVFNNSGVDVNTYAFKNEAIKSFSIACKKKFTKENIDYYKNWQYNYYKYIKTLGISNNNFYYSEYYNNSKKYFEIEKKRFKSYKKFV